MTTKRHKIALFGAEQFMGGVISDIETPQYMIHPIPKNSAERLSDFDSVIVFQGAFERLREKCDCLGASRWIDCDTDELDARFKEVIQVCKKGGFVLVILIRPLYDSYGGKTYKNTDLSKRLSNTTCLVRRDLPSPNPNTIPLRGELKDFCEKYGRAYSYFDYCSYNAETDIEYLPLVRIIDGKVVGVSIFRKIYFLPSLLPKGNKWGEYLRLLADSVFPIHKKRRAALPEWVGSINLAGETQLKEEMSGYEEKIGAIKSRLDKLCGYKRVLIESGDDLVKSVSKLLSVTTALSVDSKDDKKEDCRLVDQTGNVVALIEVKGLNGNIKMSNVSQAFEHRERTPGYENLPVVLIANTFIGSARSEEEKDKGPEEEQVSLAERHKVLILRTLDLLRMYNAVSSGQYTKEEVVGLLLTKVGWWCFEKDGGAI